MPDTRFQDLRAVLAYEGLTEDERRHGFELLEGPAPLCESYTTLLRGALADRGNLLPAHIKLAQQRGLVAGAKLFTRLLAEHKDRELTNADVARGLLAITKKGTTSADLLAMYLQTRRYCAKQQVA